jgi:hypothetical protein
MKPWQFPNNHWIDLEHVQSVSPVIEQQITVGERTGVARYFNVTMALQSNPLQFQVTNLMGDYVLSETEWVEACASLERDRTALLRAWGAVEHVELVLDLETVTDLVVYPTTETGITEVDVRFTIDGSAQGVQLVDFLRQYQAQRFGDAGMQTPTPTSEIEYNDV